MLSDQVSRHCFRNISYHYCLCRIIMAFIIEQIGKMPQHNHHQHTIDDCENSVQPKDTGVWSQVRDGGGSKRVGVWL